MNFDKSTNLFVDNLPEQIRKIWVYNLFSRFGKIREIFIPNKKSKISGRSFGFVRYFQFEDANKAVNEVNDSWYWGLKLKVNFAKFQRNKNEHSPNRNFNIGAQFLPKGKYGLKQHDNSPIENRGREVWRRKGVEESSKQGEKRNEFAMANRGTISVQSTGNGCLFRSAIAKINRLVSIEDLEYIFKWESSQIVQIKPIGGRYVIISFPDETSRDLVIKEKWIPKWFKEIKPWNGEQAKVERFVWLSCYGMPLNAWSNSTFQNIGNLWGDFLQIDESTLKASSFVRARILIATDQFDKLEGNMNLMVDNVYYSIKVIEEETFRIIKQSFFNITAEIAVEKLVNTEVEDGHRATSREKLAEKEANNGSSSEEKKDERVPSMENQEEEGVPSINEVVADSDSFNPSLGDENSIMGKERVPDSFVGISMNEQPILNPPNCLASQEANVSNEQSGDSNILLSEEISPHTALNTETAIPNIGLEVINENLEYNDDDFIEDELNQDLVEEDQMPIPAAVNGSKGKSKRKNINEILGYSKVNKGNTKGRRNKSKSVILRSAVASAALSASLSSSGINNRNRILLDEAKAIWEVDKMFGLQYDGDEREVISKIADMEALNKDRAACIP